MVNHPRTNQIFVASRGLEINNAFYTDHEQTKLYGCKINSSFQYSADGGYFRQNLAKIDPGQIDLVLLRLPRPITDAFLVWIEKIFSHAVIINKPSGIIITSNKAFLLELPGIKKEMKLCYSIRDVLGFSAKFPIVLKPLREYGGKGILKINGQTLDNGTDVHDTISYLKTIEGELESQGYLAMKYLKNVHLGDKRILVVGGEIMAASLRLPAKDSWLCNVAQGGEAMAAKVEDEEKAIIDKISPILEKKGILIFGADTLVDDDGKRILSEVNTLSVGGFMQAEEQTGKPLITKTIDKIFQYADSNI
jgi:glutathione synthase